MKHFGNEFLELLKKDGMHGSYFGYEEYLGLENCETADEFREFLLKTEYAEAEVVDDLRQTYENFKSKARVVQSRKTSSALGQMGLSLII